MMRKSVFNDFNLQEQISFGEYIPEINALLYQDSVHDGEKKRRVSKILLRNLQTGAETQISAGGKNESNPRISCDHKKVLFLSDADGMGRQLYICDLETGAVSRLTTMRFGAMDPMWSPDGKWILFTSYASDSMDADWLQTPADPAEDARYRAEHRLDPIEITDFGYKFDGLGFAKPEVMQLWVVPTDGSARAKKITSGSSNFLHACFAPDSRHVMCESNLYCNKEISILLDILMIDIDTCEIRRVTENKLVVSYPNPVRPTFTPDGKYIITGILDYGKFKYAGYPPCTLHRIDVESGEMTPICEKTDDCFDNVQFPYNAHCGRGLEKVQVSSDGQHVFFHAGYKGQACIYKVAIYGEDHIPVRLTDGKFAYNGMGRPQNGKVLVTRAQPHVPEAYFLMDEATGEMQLIKQADEAYMREVALSQVEDISFPTLDGEGEVHGFCLPPQMREDGRKYPTIVYVHGGPHPFYTYGYDLELQCFAGAGFGVIYCNPRGSSGYGDKHRHLDHATNGDAYTDILQFVDEACKRFDWIDPDRLGFTGGSYGGYMTNYTATRAKKFKAYISQRSVVNDLISYASSDMQGKSREFPTFGEFMVHEVENSTIMGMEKVNAPFLILHGQDDLRCPVEGAHQLFVALKDTHAEDFPIKMVLYPKCSHNQPTHPKQLQHYYKTMVDWFKKYL